MDATDTNELETFAGLDTELGDAAELDAELSLDDGAPAQIGRFIVLERLGQGGMGVVYSAYDNELDRKLAIKLVRPERAAAQPRDSRESRDFRARMVREAKAMARLSHPNVVHVYEVGEFDDQVYVAMEFVTGPTLGAWVRGLEAGEEPRWQRILEVYIQAGRGLEAAHAAGLVHRDFKPENAILGDDGRVRVLDFGIARGTREGPEDNREAAPPAPLAESQAQLEAKLEAQLEAKLGETPGGPARGPTRAAELAALEVSGLLETAVAPATDPLSTPLTATGAMVGTPAYMSPEQFQSQVVDARSDQFGFAVALYEALYGQRPFAGRTPTALMGAVLEGTVRPTVVGSDVPHWLRAHLLRALSVAPEQRWASMTELLDALEYNPERRRRRRRRRSRITAVALLVVSGVVGFTSDQWQRAQAAEEAQRVAQVGEERAARAEAEASLARDRALEQAEAAAVRARDTARVLAAATQDKDPTVAAALLRDAEDPQAARGWRGAATRVLGQGISRTVLRAHDDRAVGLQWSPTGEWLASAGFDDRAILWALDADGRVAAAPVELAHTDKIYTASFSSDGRRVVTASRDRSARVWRVPDHPGFAPDPSRDPNRALGPALSVELRGNEDLLWTARFSPDGRRVASAGRDGKVHLWTLPEADDFGGAESLAPDASVSMGFNIVWWTEFSPDGERLVAGNEDGTAALWRVDDPQELTILTGAENRGRISMATFSPDGRRVATGGVDGAVRIYPAQLDPLPAGAGAGQPSYRRIQPLVTLPLEHGTINRVRYSADGRALVAATHGGVAALWTLGADGLPEGRARTLAGDGGKITGVDLSRDGRWLALGSAGVQATVWPLQGGAPISLAGHTNAIFRARFRPDGRLLATASDDGSVRVWETQWRDLARELEGRDLAQSPPLSPGAGATALAVEPEHRLVVAGGHSGTARVWQAERDADQGPRALASLPGGPPTAQVVAATGERGGLIATSGQGGSVQLWSSRALLDAPAGAPATPLRVLPTPSVNLRALAFDPAGRHLFVSHYRGGGQLCVWDLDDVLAQEPALEPRVFEDFAYPDNKFSGVSALAFDDASTLVAAGGRQGGLRIWSLPDFEVRGSVDAHDSSLMTLAMSGDGRRVATASSEGSTKLWKVNGQGRAPELLAELDRGITYDLRFDDAGERLLAASNDGQVYLWDLSALPPTPQVLRGAVGEVRAAAFAFDERRVVAISLDGTARVWTLDDGPVEDAVVLPSSDRFTFMAMLDDGQTLFASGMQPKLWYWRVPTLEVPELTQRLRAATDACLSAEQRMILVGESSEVALANASACP